MQANLEIFINERGPYLGTLNVETEQIDITMGRDTYKLDPQWTFVDKAGHFHAITGDGKLPTLESYEKQVPCDGSCGGICQGEGTTETRYRCRICGRRVKPGYVVDQAGGARRVMPGRTSWTVTLGPTRVSWISDVSVRAAAGDRTMFGIARPRIATISVEGKTWEFDGITELGRRP